MQNRPSTSTSTSLSTVDERFYAGEMALEGREDPGPGRCNGIASYSFGKLGARILTLKRRKSGIVDPRLSIASVRRVMDGRLSTMNDFEDSTSNGSPCRRPPTWKSSPGMMDDRGLLHHYMESAPPANLHLVKWVERDSLSRSRN